jgi:hypothetical protein
VEEDPTATARNLLDSRMREVIFRTTEDSRNCGQSSALTTDLKPKPELNPKP